MKRVAAILLSLTVIWLQVMASAQTLPTTAAEPACGCCTAQKVCRCCCVAPAEPDAKPLPAVPVTAAAAIDFTALVPKHVAWLLPATALAIVSSTDRNPSSLAVPLFTRHCALLI